MAKSLFLNYTEAHYAGYILAKHRKINGLSEGAIKPYLFQQKLDTKYSADGKWSTITGLFKNVLADYVDIDSPAPLKARGTRGRADGEIPDISNKYHKSAKQMRDIRTMIATLATNPSLGDNYVKQIIEELFRDDANALNNVYELHEYSFLKGFSNGVFEVDQDVSNGVTLRANFQYIDSHLFKTDSYATITIDDINKITDKAKADGNVLKEVYIDATAMAKIKKDASFKEQFVFNKDIIADASKLPNLTSSKVVEFFKDEWGLTVITDGVDRTFISQKDSVETTVKPWADGVMMFTSSSNIGSLIWTHTEEYFSPTEGVKYQLAGHVLMSKFSTTDPKSESTKAETRALPVIGAVEGIYRLETVEAEESSDLPTG